MSTVTYTDEQLDEFREVFTYFDRQHTGEIHINELGLLVRSIGFHPSERLLKEIEKRYETNRINFEQFLEILIDFTNEIDDEIDLSEAFRVFDKEGQGFILREELMYIMTHLGEKFSLDEAQQMLDDADIYCDGKIRYEEFVRIMTELN